MGYLQIAETDFTRLAGGQASLHQQPYDLGHEKGVAFSVAVDGLDQFRRRLSAADVPNQLADVFALESSKFFPMIGVAAGQLGQGIGQRVGASHLSIPVGPDDQDLAIWQLAGQVFQQQQRRLVCPMQIIQHQHQWLGLGKAREKIRNRVKQSEARLFRLKGRRRLKAGQFVTYLGNDLADVGCSGAHLGAKGCGVGTLDIGTDGLDPRPVGRCAFLLVTPPPPHLCAQRFGVGGQFLGRACLPDARFAGQHHHPAVARHGIVHGSPETGHLPVAADEYPSCPT